METKANGLLHIHEHRIEKVEDAQKTVEITIAQHTITIETLSRKIDKLDTHLTHQDEILRRLDSAEQRRQNRIATLRKMLVAPALISFLGGIIKLSWHWIIRK